MRARLLASAIASRLRDGALGGSFNPGPQSTRFRGWPLHRDDVGSLNKQRSRYRSRALADEARAHAVQRQQITLLWGLSGTKVHGRSLHGLRDRLGIAIVVSCVLEECLAVLRRDESSLSTGICQVMCCEPQPAFRPARQRGTLASRCSSGMRDTLIRSTMAPQLVETDEVEHVPPDVPAKRGDQMIRRFLMGVYRGLLEL